MKQLFFVQLMYNYSNHRFNNVHLSIFYINIDCYSSLSCDVRASPTIAPRNHTYRARREESERPDEANIKMFSFETSIITQM